MKISQISVPEPLAMRLRKEKARMKMKWPAFFEHCLGLVKAAEGVIEEGKPAELVDVPAAVERIEAALRQADDPRSAAGTALRLGGNMTASYIKGLLGVSDA